MIGPLSRKTFVCVLSPGTKVVGVKTVGLVDLTTWKLSNLLMHMQSPTVRALRKSLTPSRLVSM